MRHPSSSGAGHQQLAGDLMDSYGTVRIDDLNLAPPPMDTRDIGLFITLGVANDEPPYMWMRPMAIFGGRL